MANYTLYFECAHKFGSISVKAETVKEAKEKAPSLIQHRAWCENRCENCKLKITRK